jgi:hypothetical protein
MGGEGPSVVGLMLTIFAFSFLLGLLGVPLTHFSVGRATFPLLLVLRILFLHRVLRLTRIVVEPPFIFTKLASLWWPSVNIIDPPMGAALSRPIGSKKAKKNLKDGATIDSPSPVLLQLASSQATIASSQAAIARSVALKTEFEMLSQLGDIAGARQVLEKVKALNREGEAASSVTPLAEINTALPASDDSKQAHSCDDCDDDDAYLLDDCSREEV